MGTATETATDASADEAAADRVDALLEAARYDDLEDLVSILSSGISLNSCDSQGRTALHMAAANGHLEIVEYLIRNRAVVKLLIQAGASVSLLNSHERTPMDEAVGRGKMDAIDAINSAVAQVELDGFRVD